jgi:hypothetical protein
VPVGTTGVWDNAGVNKSALREVLISSAFLEVVWCKHSFAILCIHSKEQQGQDKSFLSLTAAPAA